MLRFRERAWIGTYCSVEICYAVSLGYKVLEYFEGYVYQKQEKIFYPFMKTLAHLKLKVLVHGALCMVCSK